MDLFDVLAFIGGLCLFLFGMNLMGEALERRAGGALKSLLGKLTTSKVAGFLTGLGVTAVIQSSSATTVMVVGFVNSGLMTLRQAINVIMGANVGTTVTAWILSLGGISGDNIFIKLLKPSSFSPILALIGIIFVMFLKSDKKKDTGTILLGFATLMFGMDAMSGAASGLAEVEAFRNLFLVFENPLLGLLVGAVLTGIIQSSSASVGILQVLAATGSVSYAAAIPIIMGQNIGTCVTAMISSVGTTKNARRAAVVHLSFNIIGSTILITVFWLVKAFAAPAILSDDATSVGIAICHSAFNIICTAILLPMSSLLEKLANKLIPDAKTPEVVSELDERLLATPAVALDRCHTLTVEMVTVSARALFNGIKSLKTDEYTEALAESIRNDENTSDHYEDILGTYLVKLSSKQIGENESAEAAGLLRMISDFERISDHGVNILESSEELREKGIVFSGEAYTEICTLTAAVEEILILASKAFENKDIESALLVEPLEQVIDDLKEKLRANHISRMQQGKCTIEAGFVWNDLLTSLERTADHCSNIAGCVIDMLHNKLNIHESLRALRAGSEEFYENYKSYQKKYEV